MVDGSNGNLAALSDVGRGEGSARTRLGLHGASDELVRTLFQLTQNVQRFDSMIRNQQHLLRRHGKDPKAIDNKLIRRQSRRISSEASELLTRANGALEELRRLSQVGELGSSDEMERRHRGRTQETSSTNCS